jgi:hypothetical protein
MQRSRGLQRAFAEEYISGKASKYIRKFKLRPGDRVMILARKSNRETGNNLGDQGENLRRVIEAAGAITAGLYKYRSRGYEHQVEVAAYQAKQLGATILLAETTDRIVRNSHYHSKKRPDLQATDEQLARVVLDARCYDIKLMTHLDPDATPGEVRSYQSKRGQRLKSRKGGRKAHHPKKHRKEKKLKLVLFLHGQGWSVRRIANKGKVSVPKSTVWEWIQKYA